MNIHVSEPSELKFGVGQPVRRMEDATLVRGAGSYTDDLAVEGQLYGVFVRSPQAHGRLLGVDAAAARAMPGVAGVFTAADLEGQGYRDFRAIVSFPNRDGSKMAATPRGAFAADRVRYVGDPVALVVAASEREARDAAEAVVLDLEPLPALASMEAAEAPGAPAIYDSVPGNCVLDYAYGDADKVAQAFAAAAHVTKLKLDITRVVVAPMEPTRNSTGALPAPCGRAR